MRTTTLESPTYSKMTTDSVRFGCDSHARTGRVAAGLTDFTAELTSAVGDAYWSFVFRGELEEAIDSALLRAAIAETPILSGTGLVWTI
jgi:hypothetical protein